MTSLAHQVINIDAIAGQVQIAHAQLEPALTRLVNARAELAMAEADVERIDRQWRSLIAAAECAAHYQLGYAPLTEGQLPATRTIETYGERQVQDPCPILRELARTFAVKQEAA